MEFEKRDKICQRVLYGTKNIKLEIVLFFNKAHKDAKKTTNIRNNIRIKLTILRDNKSINF